VAPLSKKLHLPTKPDSSFHIYDHYRRPVNVWDLYEYLVEEHDYSGS